MSWRLQLWFKMFYVYKKSTCFAVFSRFAVFRFTDFVMRITFSLDTSQNE